MPVALNYTTSNTSAIVLSTLISPKGATRPAVVVKGNGQVSAIIIRVAVQNLNFYTSNQQTLSYKITAKPKPPSKIAKETRESFPAYYRTLGGSRQTRIFPPLKDI